MSRGVYLLRFSGTDKVYVGQSRNIEKRFVEHLSSFRLKSASQKLYDAYLTYGNPSLEILTECDESEIVDLESLAIDLFNSLNNGFNSMRSSGLPCVPIDDISPTAKYSKEQIIHVLDLLIVYPLKSYEEISIVTGVTKIAITQIFTGLTHKWLKEAYPTKYTKLESIRLTGRRMIINSTKDIFSTTGKYSKEQYIQVVKLLADNILTGKAVSEQTGVNVDVVRDISSLRRHRWLEVACPTDYQKLQQLRKFKH